MYLRKFALEFVANKLSLTHICQGYVTSFPISIARYNCFEPNRRLFRELYNSRTEKTNGGLLTHTRRNIHTVDNMGSSISKGRKFSPTKNESKKSSPALLEHDTEFIEAVVGKENEIPENGMKEVELGDERGKVLLVKQKGKIMAVGTKCSHYGAPLVNGHLGNGRIRCQWHGACFNLSTGDIEDFPGLDSLPCYEVKISNGDIIVRADKQLLKANKRVKPFTRTIEPEKATFLVVGGGPAGTTCVENLRAQGFDGSIIFILGEKYLPYDRIKLSKALDIEVDKIILRPLEFYRERNIEIMQRTNLCSLNPSKKLACLDNGDTIKYDKIFLATGSTPRKLQVTGSELRHIFELRTADDAKEIQKVLTPTSNVVILGTSFIGMEAAAYCAGKVNSVVVVGRDIPFKAVFGPVIGDRILKLYKENKVDFKLGQTIESFEGGHDILKTVCLSDGTKLPADVCIIGIGSTPNTYYLKSSGIEQQENGAIDVNEYLQTNFPDVFAGGDIALAPVLGQKASIGHWGLASYHGHIAAFNMLDMKKPLKAVPFFWTMLFGKGFRYTGYTRSFDDVVIDGSVDDLKFIAFYCSGDKVVAVTTIGRDPLAAKFAEMLYEDKQLLKSQIPIWVS